MNLAFILGTRPEVIKMAPVIREARSRKLKTTVIHTGQHRELTAPLLSFFEIQSDLDLAAMSEKPSITQLSATILNRLDSTLASQCFDWVFVQGDTTSAFVGAYWSFCRKQRVAHIEAGLRTQNLNSPFPEEANRQLISRIADVHFAPTPAAKHSLLSEGISPSRIAMVGNTSIDALTYTLQRTKDETGRGQMSLAEKIRDFIVGSQLIVLTTHRRENHGPPLISICRAVKKIIALRPDVRFVIPVHPNPNVRAVVEAELDGLPQVLLTEPLDYVSFTQLMNRSTLLITDSGGIQEEAPSLGKPVLVIRDSTERPEGIEAGYSELVGTDEETIVVRTMEALSNGCRGKGGNPYGNGQSSKQIIDFLESN